MGALLYPLLYPYFAPTLPLLYPYFTLLYPYFTTALPPTVPLLYPYFTPTLPLLYPYVTPTLPLLYPCFTTFLPRLYRPVRAGGTTPEAPTVALTGKETLFVSASGDRTRVQQNRPLAFSITCVCMHLLCLLGYRPKMAEIGPKSGKRNRRGAQKP